MRVSVPWQCPHLPGVVITGSDQYLLCGVQTHTAEVTAVKERERKEEKGRRSTDPDNEPLPIRKGKTAQTRIKGWKY